MREFKNDIVKAAAEQLSIDLACRSYDFLESKNTIVFSKLMFGRRNFQDKKDFFRIASFGNGAVASVDPAIYSFAEALLTMMEGIDVFDAKGVYIINKELAKYDKAIGGFNQYYLPKSPYTASNIDDFHLILLEGDDISKSYNREQFPNALLYNNDGKRRDVLAVCAKNGDNIIGIAGASNDSERFWQIGIDVHPDFRQRGLATQLVSKITREVLMRGAIPYYGTWWSNTASHSLVQGCGFEPGWVEMSAVDID